VQAALGYSLLDDRLARAQSIQGGIEFLPISIAKPNSPPKVL
jgi:hypothetical protein